MEKYLGEEQQMFAGKADFEEFIEKNIPGTTREKRLQNFVDLMGMEFVGVRFFDGVFLDLIVEGSVWVSHGGISFEFGPIPTLPYVDETWHECASPVLCYQD